MILCHPIQKFDPNSIQVVNSIGLRIGDITKDAASKLLPKIKKLDDDLASKSYRLVVKGTIASTASGYVQSVEIAFKKVSIVPEVVVVKPHTKKQEADASTENVTVEA